MHKCHGKDGGCNLAMDPVVFEIYFLNAVVLEVDG